MKKFSGFASAIKAERMKADIRHAAFVVLLCMVLLGLAVYKICASSVQYAEMSLDTYYCSVLFTVGLLIVLPAGIWFVSMKQAAVEKSSRGWLLVCVSGQNRKRVVMAKHAVNISLAALFYILLFLEVLAVMRGRGMQFLCQALLVPLCVSFLVTLPQLLLVQYFCYIVENEVVVILAGLLYTVLTFALAHTEYGVYLFTTYPYSVSAEFEHVVFKVLACAVLETALLALGNVPLKIIQKRL